MQKSIFLFQMGPKPTKNQEFPWYSIIFPLRESRQDVAGSVGREYLAAVYWSMTTLTTVGHLHAMGPSNTPWKENRAKIGQNKPKLMVFIEKSIFPQNEKIQ